MKKKKEKKKELKENKQTNKRRSERRVHANITFLVCSLVNYKNFYVTIKAATNLIPFSCMLKNFFQHEDIVLPAAFLFHWGRGIT